MKFQFLAGLTLALWSWMTPSCYRSPAAVPNKPTQLGVVEANTKKDTKQTEQLQRIRDGAEGIKLANSKQPEGLATDAVKNETDRIVDLTDLPASEEGSARAIGRVTLTLSGKIKEANDLYTAEKVNSEKLHIELAAATKQIADANTALEKSRQENAAALTKLEFEAHEREVSWLAKTIAIIGGLFLLGGIGLGIFLFYTAAITPKGLGVVGLMLGASTLTFGLIPLLAHPYLPWVVGGLVVLCALIALIIFLKNNAEVHATAEWAKEGLKRTGTFIGRLRASNIEPVIVEKVESMYNELLDKTHQTFVERHAQRESNNTGET